MTLEEFERSLAEADPDARSYLIGKLMRQAKHDDVLQFVSPQQLADLSPSVVRYLGKSREFWAWLLDKWNRVDTSGGKLDKLQKRVLDSLAAVRPPFVLGSGGALAGAHLAHRRTRDLDLYAAIRTQLGKPPGLIEARLTDDGLIVSSLQRLPRSFNYV